MEIQLNTFQISCKNSKNHDISLVFKLTEIEWNTFKINWFNIIILHIRLTEKPKYHVISSFFKIMEIQLNTFKISWFDFITLHIWLTQKLKKSWYIIGFQINWNRVKHFQNQLIWYYHITHQINAKTQKIMINHRFSNQWKCN